MSHEPERTEAEARRDAATPRSERHGNEAAARARRSTLGRRRTVSPRDHRAPGHGPADDANQAEGTKPAHNFYDPAVAEAERCALAQAQSVRGLDDEIALLRLRLRDLVQTNPDDVRLILQGINTLVRAVAAEYRLAGPDQEELVRRMADAVSQLGSLLDED